MWVTNVHLPRTSLFMLAAALAGLGERQAAYAPAIADVYRFYSYGDACLLTRAGVARTEETGTENAGEI